MVKISFLFADQTCKNQKTIRKEEAEDVVLAEEKGWNTYPKVAYSYCKAASKWWNENKVVWFNVRKYWDKMLLRKLI